MAFYIEAEDIVKELIKLQGTQKQQEQQLMVHDYEKMEEDNDSNINHEVDEADIIEEDDLEDELYEDENDDDGLEEEERKMAYKIKFQRQNRSPSNGGGNRAYSFFTMVQ